MANLGVYPVFNLQFRIGINGRASSALDMAVIKDMETFSPSVDGNVEEWTPMDTEGWVRRLMTGKGFTITLNGKRHVGDPGNDYVAGLAWKSGLDCSSKAEIVFPNGDALAFDCIVDVKTPFGGDSTNVSGLEFELQSDGKPDYVPAGDVLPKLIFLCEEGAAPGSTAINVVAPKAGTLNGYLYKIGGQLPRLGDSMSSQGWDDYTLEEDIEDVKAGAIITLVEVDTSNNAVRGGIAVAVVTTE